LYLQRLNNPGHAVHLPLGQWVTGEITTTAQYDTYTFTMESSGTIRLEVEQVEPAANDWIEPQYTVFQPNGDLADPQQCDGESNSPINVQCNLPSAGRYMVRIAARRWLKTGPYKVRVSRVAP
jgi:hypothetical protein